LVDAQTSRLIVVDYAETRGEQLELVAPALAGYATEEHPVRLVLLVRSKPREGSDWSGVLRRRRHDELDVLLDDADQHALEDLPLDRAARATLFDAAAAALAQRAGAPSGVPAAPEVLEGGVFSSPLMVVIAAYLAVHGDAVPGSRGELLEELVGHEDAYWQRSCDATRTGTVLRRRIVALSTLTTPTDEGRAEDVLRLLPDLRSVDSERVRDLARWAAELYPATAFWGALEPDLLGEHLVASTLREHPDVLSGVLEGSDPHGVVRALDVYARAAPEHPDLASVLRPILTQRLAGLCDLAVSQAAAEHDRDLMLGDMTVAAALTRAIAVIPPQPDNLAAIVDALPARPDLILGPLMLALSDQVAGYYRRLASANAAAYEPDLAGSLNNLSVRLAETGRRDEALTAIEQAVAVYRRLASANAAAYEPDLASSLNNLSVDLAEAGRRDEALAAIKQAVAVRRRLTSANAAAYEPDLAMSLNNLSNRLAETGRRDGAERAARESSDITERARSDAR
jgi:tetratricopeptide (TPR) repeat protein